MLFSTSWLSFSKTTETFFAAAAIALLAPLQASGQEQTEYCAFEVLVRSPDGKPVVGAEAVLTRDGRTVGTAVTNKAGVARICDAPSDALLDVELGGNLCGAVAVRYLRTLWMTTRRVYVTYLNCAGEEWLLAGGCQVTIRTHDESGGPLSGVVFEEGAPDTTPQERPALVSDRFGRVFRFLEYRRSLTARLKKPGYVQRTITVGCPVGSGPVREMTIVLSESKRESR